MLYVVGSGPAGVACAKALVEREQKVKMIDVGLELESDRQAKLEEVRRSHKENPQSDISRNPVLQRMKDEMIYSRENGDLPRKLAYGSDYPYRDTQERLNISKVGVGGSSSFAKGGLSTVWGGQVLPYRDEDIEDWPIDPGELDEYYRKVFFFMNYTAVNDQLQDIFPLYHENPQSLKRSEQATLFMRRLQQRKSTLNKRGIFFGYSRLALDSEGENACPYCGLEIFGCCPYGSVYNTADTLDSLTDSKYFEYEPGILVNKVSEQDDQVVIRGTSYNDDVERSFVGDKVFLGCGTVSTTKILLNSLGMYDQSVYLKESPHFVLPFLRPESPDDVTKENLSTLAQIYIEIFDENISEHPIHLETFTYNRLYDEILSEKMGPLRHLGSTLRKGILGRTIVAMGYLHSDHMDGIEISLSDSGRLNMHGEIAKKSRSAIKKTTIKLLRNSRELRAVPLIPLLEIKKPGESFHLGGTFPMSENPTNSQTDRLGRPRNSDRVHVIDSTIFPTIPAPTITATIMAMAYRIGDKHDHYE